MQKPLAVAIIGPLFVLPVLYLLIARRYPAAEKVEAYDDEEDTGF